MKQEIKEIVPGEGLGAIKFGISRKELKQLIGEPDEVDEYSYDDDAGGAAESWHYDELDLSVSFDQENDWRLITLSVSGGDYELEGEQLLGLNRVELVNKLKNMGFDDLEVEDWSSAESPDHQLIASEEAGMNFWMEDGVLSEIQWSPLFMDGEEIEWPEK